MQIHWAIVSLLNVTEKEVFVYARACVFCVCVCFVCVCFVCVFVCVYDEREGVYEYIYTCVRVCMCAIYIYIYVCVCVINSTHSHQFFLLDADQVLRLLACKP